jgi:hypothetical protein
MDFKYKNLRNSHQATRSNNISILKSQDLTNIFSNFQNLSPPTPTTPTEMHIPAATLILSLLTTSATAVFVYQGFDSRSGGCLQPC